MSIGEEAIAASRRLYPDLWEKADRVAEIIDPGAFTEWFKHSNGYELASPTVRQRYQQARALRKAWEILRALEIAPETTDWPELFREMDRGKEVPLP